MTQWTEQSDGTWRRGPLVVTWDAMHSCWLWGCGRMPLQDGGLFTREEAQQAAGAWARDMLAQLKELEEPAATNPSQIGSSVPHGVRVWRWLTPDHQGCCGTARTCGAREAVAHGMEVSATTQTHWSANNWLPNSTAPSCNRSMSLG